MKSLDQKFLIVVLLLVVAMQTSAVFGQTPDARASQAGPENKGEAAAPETRSAKVLFEEADSYLRKRYQEFNKQKLPYDQALESKTKD